VRLFKRKSKASHAGLFTCRACKQDSPFEVTESELGKRVMVYCAKCAASNIIVVSGEESKQ